MANQQRNPTKQIFARFWQLLRDNPKFSVPGAIATATYCADKFGYIQQIDSLMTWMLGPDWPSQILASPWFDVAMLIIAAFCFYRMGQAGLRHNRKIAEEMEQRAIEREGARTAALQPLAKLIKNSAEAVRLSSLRHPLEEISGRLSLFEDRIADAQTHRGPENLGGQYADLDSALRAVERQLEIESPRVAFPQAGYEEDGRTVDPANNEAYFKGVREGLNRLKARATKIEKVIARHHDELAQQNAALLR